MKDVLIYDDNFNGSNFDIFTPQECANLFNKPVKSKGIIYQPCPYSKKEETKDIVKLQICRYDDYDMPDVKIFAVHKVWLEKCLETWFLQDVINEDSIYLDLQTFLNNYTSEEGSDIYSQALLENEVVAEFDKDKQLWYNVTIIKENTKH